MKNGEDILRDIRRLHDDMGFFLMENRAANVERGYPYPGPAAKKIEEALDALQEQYRALVRPGA
jgi:hypothetical protein